jgi:hypothetical protein
MRKCLLFHAKPEGTNYIKGHYSYVDSKDAERFIKSGEASLFDSKSGALVEAKEIETDLPDDIPGKEKLIDAGLKYLGDLKKFDSFEWIPGVGKATEKQIKEWLATS